MHNIVKFAEVKFQGFGQRRDFRMYIRLIREKASFV